MLVHNFSRVFILCVVITSATVIAALTVNIVTSKTKTTTDEVNIYMFTKVQPL